MKKIIYCFLPLIALQLNSCASGKAFSREALPKDPIDLTVVTGFKNRITYRDGLLYDATSATYNNDKLPVTLNSLRTSSEGTFVGTNILTEYEYNDDGLVKYESETTYAITGGISEIKHQNIRELEYDDHKNVKKTTDTKREYSAGEIVEETITNVEQSSYVYDKNGNLTNCVDEKNDAEGEITFKRSRDYTYDNQQRLINVEAKLWNDDYDNPEGYDQLLKESHKYEGRKITDVSESLERDGDVFKTTEKITKICEYDSKYNLIHGLYHLYNLENPLKATTTEEFYEYNDKGLETNFKSYITNAATTAISTCVYRTTTYCGSNNDKIESQMYLVIKLNKFSDSNAEKTQFKSIHNYYDDKQRVIRQEINDDTKKNPTQAIYFFEY